MRRLDGAGLVDADGAVGAAGGGTEALDLLDHVETLDDLAEDDVL